MSTNLQAILIGCAIVTTVIVVYLAIYHLRSGKTMKQRLDENAQRKMENRRP